LLRKLRLGKPNRTLS